MSPQTFIMIGRSGCGKGTQGKFLAEYLKSNYPRKDVENSVYYIETGAILREFWKGEGYSNKLARELSERDERQHDFVAVMIWSNMLVANLKEDQHLIADGVSRSRTQAEVFHTALQFYKRRANLVYLNVSREWSLKMLLSRGRPDDSSAERINKRLNWFDTDVMPAIEYYRAHPEYNFIEVNGEQPIEKVSADIVEKIKIFE